MKSKLAIACFIVSASLLPVVGFAAENSDSDRVHPVAFAKDSAITTKIKAQLAAEHISSLARIQVDSDVNGMVRLSGIAHSQAEANKAIKIARGTEHLVSVKSTLTIKQDD